MSEFLEAVSSGTITPELLQVSHLTCLSVVNVDSVADPGCLSRIPDPDFYPSRIPDPKTATKERGEKKLF